MKKVLILVLLIFMMLTLAIGCTTKSSKVERVTIYQMKSFSEAKEASLIEITDEDTIIIFQKAFSTAKKQWGIPKMAEPQYKVQLGGESYFLWLGEDNATIMNVQDTHTIYRLSSYSVVKIVEIFKSLKLWIE